MTEYFGDYPEDASVLIPFNTFDSNDPSASVTITNLADSDLHVHKDGSTTEIVTDGATIAINFDGITGNHLATIDTSVDAAYATGSEYAVRMEGTTVDGATINAWIGAFSIERAGAALALLKGTNSLANIEDKIDIIDTNVDQIETAVITNAAGIDISADIAVIEGQTDDIGIAGAGLTAINLPNQTMDIIGDITGNLSGSVGSVTGNVDGNVTGSVGSNLELGPSEVNTEVDTALFDIGLNLLVNTALPTNWATDITANSALDQMADDGTAVFDRTTDSLQAIADSGGGGPTAAQIADAVWDELLAGHVIVDSTGLLLNEWQDGGRLNLILDARMAEASIDTTGGAVDNVTLVATTTANTDMRGTDSAALASVLGTPAGASVSADIADVPTVSEFNARTLLAASYFDPAADTVADVTLVATTTTNTDMRGTDSAALASVATEARLSELDEATGGKMANQVDIIQIDTTTDLPAQITALNNVSIADILASQLTESYAVDGVAPTLTQALFLIQQMLGDFAIAGTTLTVREIDGSTTAATFTLDDGTSPTSITRAT